MAAKPNRAKAKAKRAARASTPKASAPKAPPPKAPAPKTSKTATKTSTKTSTLASTKTSTPAPAPPRPDKPQPAAVPKPHKGRAAFPKKNQPPSHTEFTARLPLALGKRLEGVRGFLSKQPGVREELYYYGPKTGWAYRYVRGAQSLCSIVIHDERLMGIVALDAAAQTAIVWEGLSPVAQKARNAAHGSPTLLWIDVPFDGTGAKDFQTLLKGKLRTLPAPSTT